jgi:hypothetical protein
MQIEERLQLLLDRWLAEADAGRLLDGAELCRDCPDLRAEAERHLAVLRQFHILARPSGSTAVEAGADPETLSDERARAVPAGPLPVPGTPFGRYRILAELGQGGMGIVYRAHDMQLDREVALKVLRPEVAANPQTAARFLREARALAAVRHDHVVEVYDYGERDGVRFVTMPLLRGETLHTRLERHSPLSVAEVIRIGTELAAGLAAVHEQGLIHRDLKPANVWLEALTGRVKLLDFGLAHDPGAGDRLTRTGAVVGTPAYMSPEQVNGLDLDARSDLFSLGSVLYRAATGRPAFAGPTQSATLAAVGEKDPPPAQAVNPVVPAALSDLIARLHGKRPADRPASAAAVVEALRGLAAGQQVTTVDWPGARPGAPGRQGRPNRVRLAVACSLGLLLVLGTLLVSFVLNRSRDDGGTPRVAAAPKGPAEPLRVRALEVLHFEHFDDKRTRPGRLLGTDSFGAALNDDIKVTARLSRPAYAYLIVFRPDGKDEVVYPQGALEAPAPTDAPQYPSKDRGKVYGLTEGTGLWLVALVASDSLLPPYADWRQQHAACPWVPSEGEGGVVWLDDGHWLEAVTPRGVRQRGGRGEKEAAGTAPIVRVVDWLKAATGGSVSAVGFTVAAKR